MLRIGLALGGGSSKGLSHIGVLKALSENDIPIACISGTSMGAIIGAIYASSPDLAHLVELTKKFTASKTFQDLGLSVFKKEEEGRVQKIIHMIREKIFFAEALFKPYLVERKEINELIEEIIPDIDMDKTVIPFSTLSLDLITGMDVIKKKGSLREAVMSSMAIPGLFPYIEEADFLLVDGGSTSSIPVYATKTMGADVVIAVSLRGGLEKKHKPGTGLEIHLRIDEIVTTRLIESQVMKADIVIKPDVEDVHWADFSRFDYCIEKGYEAAELAIPRIQELVREKSSIRGRVKNFFSRKKTEKKILFQKVID